MAGQYFKKIDYITKDSVGFEDITNRFYDINVLYGLYKNAITDTVPEDYRPDKPVYKIIEAEDYIKICALLDSKFRHIFDYKKGDLIHIPLVGDVSSYLSTWKIPNHFVRLNGDTDRLNKHLEIEVNIYRTVIEKFIHKTVKPVQVLEDDINKIFDKELT